MANRITEIRKALLESNPSVVEVIVATTGVLFSLWTLLPFHNDNPHAVIFHLTKIAPLFVWSIVFILPSILIFFSTSFDTYRITGMLLSVLLWGFLFFTSIINTLSSKTLSLATPAFFSIVLFCSWSYLRRMGVLRGAGDPHTVVARSGSIRSYSDISVVVESEESNT